jgi:hypothetical protein
MAKSDYFKSENENIDSKRTEISPSGRYRLSISSFTTKAGSWNYTQGIVISINNDKPIAIIQRNYSSFLFCGIEDHVNGHDYLVTGEDYQGQTVIELDTCRRLDVLSDGPDNGFGFCWADVNFDKPSQLLVVEGCHWACPYEFRFYDFSNPMSGWPGLKCDDIFDSDVRRPTIDCNEFNTIIKSFQTRYVEDDSDDDTEIVNKVLPPIDITKTFRREGNNLVMIHEEVSEYQLNLNKKNEEGKARYDAWKAQFTSSDPLYLTYTRLVKDVQLTPDTYESIGQVHTGWCPDYPVPDELERTWNRRIVTKGIYTIDLAWAVIAGPIILNIYKHSNNLEVKVFEHSVSGMEDAFRYVKDLLNESI